jgi:hypothetical protein
MISLDTGSILFFIFYFYSKSEILISDSGLSFERLDNNSAKNGFCRQNFWHLVEEKVDQNNTTTTQSINKERASSQTGLPLR